MVLRKWARPEKSAAGFHFSGSGPPFTRFDRASTYFLPVCELTSMYINVLLSTFDEQMAMFLLDERAKFQPAGIKRFGKSHGGRLHDDPDDSRVASILAIETIIVEFMLAEQAFMVHNLSLMEQAMGLGGWTHFASAQETTWFEVLGFKLGSQRLSQIMNAGPLRRFILRLKGAARSFPYPLGHIGRRRPDQAFLSALLPLNGRCRSGIPETQANERHRRDIARALPRLLEGSRGGAGEHSEIRDECIAATIAYCTYVYETYGKFPAYFGPLRTTLAHQAHHLDLDFYDKFYHPGAYTETQKNHHHRWHGG
jgi:hypothetical protein